MIASYVTLYSMAKFCGIVSTIFIKLSFLYSETANLETEITLEQYKIKFIA